MRWSLLVLAGCGAAPPHPPAPPDEALFYRGVDAAKAHDAAAERTLLSQLLATYPQSRFHDSAVILLADLALEANQLESARAQYESVHVRGELANYVHYRHAWTQYDLGAYDAAAAELTDLIPRTTGMLHNQSVVDLADWRYRRADAFYAQHAFCDAAPLFGDVVRAEANPRTEWKQREDAGYAHVLATLSCQHLDDAKPDGSPAWDPVIAAIDLYVGHTQHAMPAMLFKRGQILYGAARFHEAAADFRRIVTGSPGDETAPYAAVLLLDSDNEAHDDVAADLAVACAVHGTQGLAQVCANQPVAPTTSSRR